MAARLGKASAGKPRRTAYEPVEGDDIGLDGPGVWNGIRQLAHVHTALSNNVTLDQSLELYVGDMSVGTVFGKVQLGW